jgi:hypothetical protein
MGGNLGERHTRRRSMGVVVGDWEKEVKLWFGLQTDSGPIWQFLCVRWAESVHKGK